VFVEMVLCCGLSLALLNLPFANKKRKKKFSERIALGGLHSVCLLIGNGAVLWVVSCALRCHAIGLFEVGQARWAWPVAFLDRRRYCGAFTVSQRGCDMSVLLLSFSLRRSPLLTGCTGKNQPLSSFLAWQTPLAGPPSSLPTSPAAWQWIQQRVSYMTSHHLHRQRQRHTRNDNDDNELAYASDNEHNDNEHNDNETTTATR
jgi:hypothetical protein